MDLQGPRAKLDWARKHLDVLNEECQSILETEPFYISDEFDPDSGCHVMRLRLRENAFPSFLGLRVGDIVHNARSSLDQAVWLIACRSNSTDYLWQQDIAWKIAFPVLWEPKRFMKHKVMPFIADDAKAVLDSLQPYKRGDTAQALGQLDTLSNIDKHRVIHKCVARLDRSGVSFHPRSIFSEDSIGDPPEMIWQPRSDRLEDGAEIASIRFRDGRGPPYTEVKVEGHPSARVAFGSGFFALPVEDIGDLLAHTEKALSMIEALPDDAQLLQR